MVCLFPDNQCICEYVDLETKFGTAHSLLAHSSPQAFAQLEKLARDADAFVQQVMAAVAPELAANTDQLMHMVR